MIHLNLNHVQELLVNAGQKNAEAFRFKDSFIPKRLQSRINRRSTFFSRPIVKLVHIYSWLLKLTQTTRNSIGHHLKHLSMIIIIHNKIYQLCILFDVPASEAPASILFSYKNSYNSIPSCTPSIVRTANACHR